MNSPLAPTSTFLPAAQPRRRWSAYLELTKARLVGLVALSAGVGFVMSSPGGVDWTTLIYTLLGTALTAGGANTLNQCLERKRDALMPRTRQRPLPSGQISVRAAVQTGLTLSLLGPLVILFAANGLAAGLAFANVLIYVLLYTPLKTRTSLNTLIGGVCGAIPPMLGWAAASGDLPLPAWVLGLLLYIWQIPHFLAFAWLHRPDYARAGYLMLPQADHSGQLTARIMLLSSLSLIPIGLMVALAHLGGLLLAGSSLTLGLLFSWTVLCFQRDRSDASARRVFIASLIYLPALFATMLLGRFV